MSAFVVGIVVVAALWLTNIGVVLAAPWIWRTSENKEGIIRALVTISNVVLFFGIVVVAALWFANKC